MHFLVCLNLTGLQVSIDYAKLSTVNFQSLNGGS